MAREHLETLRNEWDAFCAGDTGVEGLLLGKRSTESPASFERWLKAREPRE
jgi:hypothetical protein